MGQVSILNLSTGQHELRDETPEEEAERNTLHLETSWAALRARRDSLLLQSDWTQVADAPVDASAWSTYRQALRDLPANTTDPLNPVWPTPPS